MKSIHIIITGVVTGVGFRWWLKKKADQKNINGWVKNNIKNEVEALLIGNEKDLNKIIKLCREGPSSAKVYDIKTKNYLEEYFNKSFDIVNN